MGSFIIRGFVRVRYVVLIVANSVPLRFLVYVISQANKREAAQPLYHDALQWYCCTFLNVHNEFWFANTQRGVYLGNPQIPLKRRCLVNFPQLSPLYLHPGFCTINNNITDAVFIAWDKVHAGFPTFIV